MWYEALPPLVIITAATLFYQNMSQVIMKAFTGKPFAIDTSTCWDRNIIERNTRVSGSPWVQAGLENIPDDD